MNTQISLATHIIQSNIQRLQRPYKLTYAVTYRCNSRCEICNIWKKPIRHELEIVQIQRFFETNRYFNWIDITGGEIFLRMDLLEIMKIIIRTQPKLYLLHTPTNGFMTDRIYSVTKAILANKPKNYVISISLDGPKTVHDKLRGVKGAWDHAVATYKKLRTLQSKSFSCYFGMTISGHNEAVLEQTYIELKNEIPHLKRSDLHLNIAHVSSHYYGNSEKQIAMSDTIANTIQSFTNNSPFPTTPMRLLEKIYQKNITRYLRTGKTPMPCKSLSSSIFINPYGIIFPCAMWNYPLGNIADFDYDIQKIWHASQTMRALKTIMQKKCPHCWTPCEAYQTILGNLTNPTIWNG